MVNKGKITASLLTVTIAFIVAQCSNPTADYHSKDQLTSLSDRDKLRLLDSERYLVDTMMTEAQSGYKIPAKGVFFFEERPFFYRDGVLARYAIFENRSDTFTKQTYYYFDKKGILISVRQNLSTSSVAGRARYFIGRNRTIACKTTNLDSLTFNQLQDSAARMKTRAKEIWLKKVEEKRLRHQIDSAVRRAIDSTLAS